LNACGDTNHGMGAYPQLYQHCLDDVAATQQATKWSVPWIAATAEEKYESVVYRVRDQSLNPPALVPQQYADNECTGFVESSLSFLPRLSGTPVEVTALLTLCTDILLGETITLKLPGFTGATSAPPCEGLLCIAPELTTGLTVEGQVRLIRV